MIQRFGIDTSVFLRLLTGKPAATFKRCSDALTSLVADQGAEIYVSSQVIGEAYFAVQHHYGVSKADARSGLLDLLRSGLVAPLNGQDVIAVLRASGGPGLMDRLIADEYMRVGLDVLTLDRKMATLPTVQKL